MPLDDRLRAGLTRDKAYRPPGELDVFADVVARAGHRRRIRGLAIGAAAAVLLVLVAAAVPWALRTVRSDEPVVERPTTTNTTSQAIDDWRPPARTSPIDGGGWRTGSMDEPDRLAVLEGTGLERFGSQVARKAAMDQAFSETEFLQGTFTGILQSHNLGTIEVLPSGTFEVAGKQVVITFDSGGEAVFRWSKPDGDTLVLTFVSTTAPSMYGAPAEVFLRMWAAAPFVLQ